MIELSGLLLVGLAWWRCCCSDGGCCKSGTSPTSVDVEFSGVSDGTCEDCEQAAPDGYNNVTFNLTQDSTCTWSGPGLCGHTIYLAIASLAGSHWWELAITDGGPTDTLQVIYKTEPVSSYVDCGVDATGISRVAGQGDNTECDWTGSTCDLLPQ